jgi:glycosyltransferase involved in cell wall biosynthesis
VEHERFPASKVVVITNGVDVQKFSPSPDAAAIRRELGLGETVPVVGIVAALRPEKNHELFLEAARRVAVELPDAKFLILGDGPRRELLVRRASELGVAAHVHFLGSRGDVPRILTAMDVFALTSHIEANPVSILEAMSVGRPVVSTNVGSIHEVIAHGRTGYLVPAGNVEELAKNILALLQNPLSRVAMGDAARRAVVERWSVEAMVRGYEDLIESTFERQTARGRRAIAETRPLSR